MKKNIKFVYLIELILFAFVIIFKFMINDGYSFRDEIIVSILWVLLLVFLIIKGGFPKDNNYLKKSSIRTIIISLMFYFIIIYILGLFTGFAKEINFANTISFIKRICITLVFIVSSELIRYLTFKRNPNKLQIVLFTILMICLNMVTIINFSLFTSLEKTFLVVSVLILPIIARECLYSYITYNVSYVPTLILHLVLGLYTYIFPIVPSLGNYITSVCGIVFPYMVYKQIGKSILYKEKYNIYAKKYLSRFCYSLILIFGIGLTILVSGIFKYQMIAIVSGSMEPVYYRGDAVIFEKKDASEIKKGDILVFRHDNTYITHRVINITQSGSNYKFTTKGDNNDTRDVFDTSSKDVVGVVKYIVKYIGYPTVWFNKK